MGYLLLLASTFAIYSAAGLCVGVFQIKTSSFCIVAGACFAIGGYTTGVLLTNSISEALGIITLTVIISGLLGAIIAILTAFHDNRVLDIVGLSLLLVGGAIVRNWYDPAFDAGTLKSLTNGSFGLSGFPEITLFGFSLPRGRIDGLVISTIAFVYCILIVQFFQKSLWGISLDAIRDNRLQAALDGHRITQRHIGMGIILGSGLGVCGAAYCITYRYIDPSIWSIESAIGICLVPLLWPFGGIRTRAVVGAIAFVSIPELLREVNIASPYETYLRNIIFLTAALTASMLKRPSIISTYKSVSTERN